MRRTTANTMTGMLMGLACVLIWFSFRDSPEFSNLLVERSVPPNRENGLGLFKKAGSGIFCGLDAKHHTTTDLERNGFVAP